MLNYLDKITYNFNINKMAKPSAEEKLVLAFLVINCEIYKLNEQEAIQYIHFNFKPISRRTYYKYKKIVYRICLSSSYSEHENDNKKDFQFLELSKMTGFVNSEQLRFLLPGLKDRLIKEALEMKICLNDFDKLSFFPTHFINLNDHAESVLNHSRNFMEQTKQELQSSNINRKSIPGKVTIRREYIKCGKETCKKCNHGPYYYGYWREKNGKLKKKYIGINN